VSFPVTWGDLQTVRPGDHTIATVVDELAGRDPWRELMPEPQRLPRDLVEEGHSIPVARVQAMHEGKRRVARERSG
jgi:bifunctional non-homologous end joining protein LigD